MTANKILWTAGLLVALVFTVAVCHAIASIDVWKSVCRGANMYSENSDQDLNAARKYGVKTVRLGATGDQNDFRYLVDANGNWSLSDASLHRLRQSIRRFEKQGFNVVITLSHVPGRFWGGATKDVRIFQDRNYQEQFFQAWKTIAKELSNETSVVGYDLINEPLLPEEVGKETADINYQELAKQIKGSTSDINAFYRQCISAIREVDKHTPIILETTGTGDFSSIAILEPSADPFVLYSFHYYDPPAYYRGRVKHGQLKYPERIGDSGNWDKARHRANFEKVEAWRKLNKIEPYHIYVGEFGAWKDAIGANQYLKDVVELLDEYGWSWTYYAFREDSYAHVDLELANHLEKRAYTPLFEIVADQFR